MYGVADGSDANANVTFINLTVQNNTNYAQTVDSTCNNFTFLGGIAQGSAAWGLSATSCPQVTFRGSWFEGSGATDNEGVISSSTVTYDNCHFTSIGALITASGSSVLKFDSCYFAAFNSTNGGRLTITGTTIATIINTSPQLSAGVGTKAFLIGYNLSLNSFSGAGFVLNLDTLTQEAYSYTVNTNVTVSLSVANNGTYGVAGSWEIVASIYNGGTVQYGVWNLTVVKNFGGGNFTGTLTQVVNGGLTTPTITPTTNTSTTYTATFQIPGPGATFSSRQLIATPPGCGPCTLAVS
jgi:hypothetical protein